jgi:RNA polymerase sigma-70 factor (ECF subfamily)
MIENKWSDSELVSRYQQGNEGAFEILLHRHKSRLYTAIYLIVKDRYVAEDILQDTFIKAIKTIRGGGYNEEGKFSPWISRIAHNLAIDHFRKNRRYPEVVLESGQSRVPALSHHPDGDCPDCGSLLPADTIVNFFCTGCPF